jgi:phosphatidate cytidylyltransferase
MTSTSVPAPARRGRTGRNLPAAIGVGLVLGGLIVASLVLAQWGFAVLATASLMVGVWELRLGMAQAGVRVPALPLLAGTATMIPAAYAWGPRAIMVTFGVTLLAVVCWRAAMGPQNAARDIGAGIFVVTYAPFLACFSSLMLAAPDGPARILVFVLVTSASDIGGFALGVARGKHPLAPSVSPKKSWEGLAGSTMGSVLAGGLAVPLTLGGPWWAGVLVGVAAVSLATLGDLTESMLKRDLGIKDLGSILPGHGGLMDRLDSLLVAAPAVWWLLAVFVPPA